MPSEYKPNLGVVAVTSSTLTARVDAHAGVPVVLNRAAGIAVTLPAATGSGASFEFIIGATVTSNTTTIKVANATDVMGGALTVATDIAGVTCPTTSTSDTITMNGSTTGGIIGSRVKLIDVASGLWSVSGELVSSGTEATPFSATVS